MTSEASVPRILLVEDDEAHAELIRRSFEASQQPVQLVPASTLREAQAAIARESFDLVIADLRLPDGDGTELLPGDRDQARFPVVVMTSHGDEQVAVDAMKTGAIDYVVKSEDTFASMPRIADRALRSFSLILERRRAEQRVRESEGRLRLALEAARMGAWEWDVPNRRPTWTEGIEAILGLPPGEFAGTPNALIALIHPKDREMVDRAIGETISGSRAEFHFEHRIVPSAGPVRWLEARGRASLDGEGRTILVQGTLADVTRRKRAEEALRDSEERWQRLAEAAFEGIGFVDEGRVVDASAQLAAMLGYQPREMIGRAVSEFVSPDSRSLVERMAGSSQAYEHLALRKDGTSFPVEVRGRETTYEGRSVRVVAILDLSERKELEARLRRREKLAAIGSLVAGVAHEVRTPLFSISATVDAYEGHLASPNEQQELIGLLRSQVNRLSNLMSDLLDYAHPPKLELVAGGVEEVVRRAVRSCESLAREARVEIRDDIAADLPVVNRDAGRLEQVFQNLLANAIQHAAGSSEVRLIARPAQAGARRGITLSVEDEGPGLAGEDLSRVFEPLFSRRKGGSGLGLSIVQRIVEEHGGSVSAGNKPGGGAVFTVFLPSAAVAP